MKTKSKLVLGLSILSAAAMASATTATFAWFTASPSMVASDTASNIQASEATLAGATLTPTITANDKPVLTDGTGDAYVWNGSAAVLATNNSSALKRGKGTITLAAADNTEKAKIAAAAGGLTYNVYITGGGQLRVLSQNTSKATTAAVTAAEVTADTVATKGILIGTLTFDVDGTVGAYSSKEDAVTKTDKLYFYYSITGRDADGDDAHKSDASWGDISFVLEQA